MIQCTVLLSRIASFVSLYYLDLDVFLFVMVIILIILSLHPKNDYRPLLFSINDPVILIKLPNLLEKNKVNDDGTRSQEVLLFPVS